MGQEALQAVSSVGFPIVACAAMYIFSTREMKSFTESMTGQISRLTEAITRIDAKLDALEEAHHGGE